MELLIVIVEKQVRLVRLSRMKSPALTFPLESGNSTLKGLITAHLEIGVHNGTVLVKGSVNS